MRAQDALPPHRLGQRRRRCSVKETICQGGRRPVFDGAARLHQRGEGESRRSRPADLGSADAAANCRQRRQVRRYWDLNHRTRSIIPPPRRSGFSSPPTSGAASSVANPTTPKRISVSAILYAGCRRTVSGQTVACLRSGPFAGNDGASASPDLPCVLSYLCVWPPAQEF
jgi:hypothetical protein